MRRNWSLYDPRPYLRPLDRTVRLVAELAQAPPPTKSSHPKHRGRTPRQQRGAVKNVSGMLAKSEDYPYLGNTPRFESRPSSPSQRYCLTNPEAQVETRCTTLISYSRSSRRTRRTAGVGLTRRP
ncbi:unnamed protein product [Rhizoctonia solani]|uniref:Uncharacterized protein n=1 Tax=Rhizoctonia solani TaxID=456999 RepID=A0A8H3CRW8_9AGAM|nr:unnamed protein product [Rhizoctonia solani]